MKRYQVILSLIVLLIFGSACGTPSAPAAATSSRSIEASATPSQRTATPTLTVLATTATPTTTPTATPSKTPTPSNYGVRDAVEFETLPIKMADSVATSVQDMSPFGAQQWSNGKQLFGSGKEGSAITFDVTVNATARYALDLYLTLAPDFAILQLTVDGKKYGAPIDLYTSKVGPSGRIPAGGFDLSAGTHELGLRIVGKNQASSNYKFGLDSFTLTPSQSVVLAITPGPTPTVTPPPPNPAYPLLTVQIQAIQMADDDGKRLTPITSDQVKQWVDKANEIWAVASIRYLYDPDSDFPTIKNTLVNSMEADADANAPQNKRLANEIAARYRVNWQSYFGGVLTRTRLVKPFQGLARTLWQAWALGEWSVVTRTSSRSRMKLVIIWACPTHFLKSLRASKRQRPTSAGTETNLMHLTTMGSAIRLPILTLRSRDSMYATSHHNFEWIRVYFASHEHHVILQQRLGRRKYAITPTNRTGALGLRSARTEWYGDSS